MKHGNVLKRYTGTNPNIYLIHILTLVISTATVLSQVRLQGKCVHHTASMTVTVTEHVHLLSVP